jgi:SPP1 family predicted phage head-tail adaptor
MMRHTVVVQRATKTANGSGGFTTSWATLLTLKASVENKSGQERMRADRVEAVRSVLFIWRYSSTQIREGDRVLFRGMTHNIRFIDNIEYANKWLRVTCDQGVPT